MPESIGNLEVADFIPRHIWTLHGDALTHNDHGLEINCYPPDVIPDKFIESKVVQPDQLEGQMSIEELLGGET